MKISNHQLQLLQKAKFDIEVTRNWGYLNKEREAEDNKKYIEICNALDEIKKQTKEEYARRNS